MTKNKALEPSAFAASAGGSAAAAQPAKVSSLKKTSRSRKATSKAESAVSGEVAESPVAPLESRTAQPKTPRAKSTAVTHRHKKLEIAQVAEMEPLRVESAHGPLAVSVPQPLAEPSSEEIAKLAYSYYVARGYQSGNQAEDWFRAVAELRARLTP